MSNFGFQLICLTAEEDDYQYDQQQQDDQVYWTNDSECQENLGTILALNPEETIIDKDNHIQSLHGVQLFFEELGCLTEEPEPIDPTIDYEAEAKILLEERNKKTRKHHINIPLPSLDDTNSGRSSACSSFHSDEPLYFDQSNTKPSAYTYCTFNNTVRI